VSRLWLCLFAILPLVASCERQEPGQVRLEVGRDDDEHRTFAPVSAFAEYVELPGLRHELTITLASYRASCTEYVPPGDHDALVTVVVTTPTAEPPHPGTYAWGNGGDRARSLPTVRLGSRGYELSPGGSITLTDVELQAQGVIAGHLDFEFAGGAERPAQSLHGRFRVRLCRFSQARTG
jgi:hypothetical protein